MKQKKAEESDDKALHSEYFTRRFSAKDFLIENSKKEAETSATFTRQEIFLLSRCSGNLTGVKNEEKGEVEM